MRSLLSLLLILFSFNLSAQSKFPEIQLIEVEDRIFHGKIDEDPLTIYLKFHQYCRYHNDAYSVSGWFSVDGSTKRTSLAGLFDRGQLFLYHFAEIVSNATTVLVTFMRRFTTPIEFRADGLGIQENVGQENEIGSP